jgi:phage gp36-like protein
MAHPYTTRARLDALIRPERLVVLLDIDQDGVEDTGVFTDIIERAANAVDADLARYYEVPFASLTSTPGIISDLTDYAAAVLLFQLGGAPSSEDAKNFLARYDALLERITSGRAAVPGATEAAADSGATATVFSYETPVFSGSLTAGDRRSSGLF